MSLSLLPQREEHIAPGQSRDRAFGVHPWRVARGLSVVTAVLVIAHLAFTINDYYLGLAFPGLTQLYVIFDMHGEEALPTWYTSSLLLLCSVALAGVAAVAVRRTDGFRFHWIGLAVILLGLSIEESVDIHGTVSRQIQSAFDTGGALSYPWVIPAAVMTLIVGTLYIRFLRALEPRFRRLFIIAGGLYVGGALGLEFIEAAYESAFGEDFVYILMVTAEETLEIAGATVLLYAVLIYLGIHAGRISLDISPE